MVPHLVRIFCGADLRVQIPVSAMDGALLLILADVLGRYIGRPGELEVGIVTAFLGAPVFILVVRKAKVHSNGFSLVRKALFEKAGHTVDTVLDELDGEKLGDVLLTPTKIYVKALSPLFKAGVVKGVAHITGGGFIENVPRMIPDGLAAHINLGSWPVLPIFDVLEKAGEVDHMEMFNIFNMGIGMVLAVNAEDADKTMELLKSNDEAGYVLGNIVKKTDSDVELQ